jgi:hypothetical protein
MSLTALLDRAEQAPRRTTDVQVLFDASTVDRLEDLEAQRRQAEADLEQVELDLADELEQVAADLRNSDPRPAKIRKAATERTKTVQARIDALTTEIAALNEAVAADLVTFRFTALEGWEWDEITARSVPREGVAEDAGRTYNMDEVCKIAAKRTGVLVTGDDSTEPVSGEEWDRIWRLLRGSMKLSIKSSIWYLNEYQWDAAREAALTAARKASEATAARTSPSRSVSESHPAA